MWPYWVLFLAPAWAALNATPRRAGAARRERWPTAWRWAFIALALMIGLRGQVGGDWLNFLPLLARTAQLDFWQTLSTSDPGYGVFNWLGSHWGGGIYLVNTLCGVVFAWGLVTFCRAQPRPWLALVVAVPYLIMVVGMGYSRQGVAVGFEMLGLVALAEGRTVGFLKAMVLGATFHKSAVALIPLGALLRSHYRVITGLLIAVAGWIAYRLFLEASVDRLVAGYLDAKMASSGAAIRLTMNALPAAIFLRYRRRFNLPSAQRAFWTWLAVLAWVFVILLFVLPSSTVVDRLALYWIPLQLFVWSRAPDVLCGPGGSKKGWVWAIVGYSALVHFTWLNFATHARYWLPYRFYPWEWLWE